MRPLTVLVLLAVPGFARAGYEPPCHIDGCRSADGRFVVTADAHDRTRAVVRVPVPGEDGRLEAGGQGTVQRR
jgi:hypothetical protein